MGDAQQECAAKRSRLALQGDQRLPQRRVGDHHVRQRQGQAGAQGLRYRLLGGEQARGDFTAANAGALLMQSLGSVVLLNA